MALKPTLSQLEVVRFAELWIWGLLAFGLGIATFEIF